VWGHPYLRTGNLWGPLAAHTLTNSAINFIHIRGAAGMDSGLSIRMTIFTIVMLLGLAVIQAVSRTYRLPQLAPWK